MFLALPEGLTEDREVAVAIRRGLAGGASEHVLFGLFEGALTRFHRGLAELLGPA